MKNDHTSKFNLQTQCNPKENSHNIFTEIEERKES